MISKKNVIYRFLCIWWVLITMAPRSNRYLVHIITIFFFFFPFGICFSSGCGSFLMFQVPWNADSPPGPRAQVSALAEVRGKCSGGSKLNVPSGRHSEYVEPSRPLETHVRVKRISDGSC